MSPDRGQPGSCAGAQKKSAARSRRYPGAPAHWLGASRTDLKSVLTGARQSVFPGSTTRQSYREPGSERSRESTPHYLTEPDPRLCMISQEKLLWIALRHVRAPGSPDLGHPLDTLMWCAVISLARSRKTQTPTPGAPGYHEVGACPHTPRSCHPPGRQDACTPTYIGQVDLTTGRCR